MKVIVKIVLISLIFINVLILPAYADSYLDKSITLKESGVVEAHHMVQKIPNNEISIERVKNIDTVKSAVGTLQNTKNKFYGTAFAIDDYTLITNNHVVEENFGIAKEPKYHPEKPENLIFSPSRNGDKRPYQFTIKDVKMIKGADVAILHTNKKLSSYITPLKLANIQDLPHFKFKDNITVLGYPAKGYLPELFSKDLKYTMYASKGYYLMKAKSIDPQFYIKSIVRKGSSGSPILNSENEVIGIIMDGSNNVNASLTVRSKNELAYAYELSGYIREQIEKERY